MPGTKVTTPNTVTIAVVGDEIAINGGFADVGSFVKLRREPSGRFAFRNAMREMFSR